MQGVLSGPLAAAADVVLPGAAWVEKDGCFTNDQGRVQAASKAMVTRARPWRTGRSYERGRRARAAVHLRQSAVAVRADLAAALAVAAA